MSYRIYLHFKVLPKWLKLSRNRRREIFENEIQILIGKFREINFSWIDLEAFSSDVTDIAELTTSDIQRYYFFIEELKDSQFFTEEYFDLVKIQMGIIEGFKHYEQQQQKETT
tara:strand:+ start:34546 stop:34884 length:339 start_codon:yes stop_codon:yes gene_type:complete